MKTVKFAYVDEFHCVGADCSDNCCRHWTITLSQKEYSYYRDMECSPELKAVMNSAFFRVKSESELCYAAVKLKENFDCPFLDADKLCMIQKEKGEEALSYTCKVFPHLCYGVGGEACVRLCSLNCSSAVELLIAHPEGLEIIEEEYKGDDEYINRGIFSGDSIPASWGGCPYYWNIRGTQLGILQNRSFTVPERMLILGYYSMKADKYVKRSPEKLPALSEMMLDNELCREIADSLKTSQSDESAAAKSVNIISKMYDRSVKSGNISEFACDRLRRVTERIGIRKSEVRDGKKIKIVMGYDNREYQKLISSYRELEGSRSYIIENVLVNTVFSQALHKGIWANFFSLAVFYNCLKVCVPAFLEEEYTDKELALAISYTSKIAINTRLIQNGTLLDFLDNLAYDLPHAAFLIS